MSWPGRPPRWHPLRSPPTRFGLLKLLILLFFFVLVLAPFTGWLMSLPMWLMDVLGVMVSSQRHSPGERWFRGALLLGGVACTVAVLWRAREDGDRDLGKRALIAAAILGVYLAATYPSPRAADPPRPGRAASGPAAVQAAPSRAVAPGRRGDAPPPLSLQDYEAVAARLLRGAARSAADGDPFFRQQLSMLRELRKARTPGEVDSARYQAAMRDYRRLSGATGAASLRPAAIDAAPIRTASIGAASIEAASIEAASIESASIEAASIEAASLEASLQSALAADPNSALAAGELGRWRLRTYLRALQADDARVAGDARQLRKLSEAARAGFIQALSRNPSYPGGWRGLAWTWLYDDPELARGALTIEADQRFGAGAADSAFDPGGGAQRPRFEVLQARARKAVMDLRGLSVPREIGRLAEQDLPAGRGTTPAPSRATPDAGDPAGPGAARLGAVDLLAEPWHRGALRVASGEDQQAWVRASSNSGSAILAADFRGVLLGLPRFRVVRGFELPKGLDRVGPAVFLVPARIDRPRGELGNSLVLDSARGDCTGRYCDSLVSLD